MTENDKFIKSIEKRLRKIEKMLEEMLKEIKINN